MTSVEQYYRRNFLPTIRKQSALDSLFESRSFFFRRSAVQNIEKDVTIELIAGLAPVKSVRSSENRSAENCRNTKKTISNYFEWIWWYLSIHCLDSHIFPFCFDLLSVNLKKAIWSGLVTEPIWFRLIFRVSRLPKEKGGLVCTVAVRNAFWTRNQWPDAIQAFVVRVSGFDGFFLTVEELFPSLSTNSQWKLVQLCDKRSFSFLDVENVCDSGYGPSPAKLVRNLETDWRKLITCVSRIRFSVGLARTGQIRLRHISIQRLAEPFWGHFGLVNSYRMM